MTSSGGGPFDFHNIQEIEDIELNVWTYLQVFLYLFFFYPHYKWSEKRKPTIKQKKVENYYYTI